MATYEETKKVYMDAFPSLYPTEHDLLEQLFFVLGNGFRWINGELSEGITLEQVIEDSKAMRINYNLQLTKQLTERAESEKKLCSSQKEIDKIDQYYKIRLDYELESEDPEIERQKELHNRKHIMNFPYFNSFGSAALYFLCSDGKTIGKKIYPISELSKIMNIPKDIKPDWLEAIKKTIEFCDNGVFKLTDADLNCIKTVKYRLNNIKV